MLLPDSRVKYTRNKAYKIVLLNKTGVALVHSNGAHAGNSWFVIPQTHLFVQNAIQFVLFVSANKKGLVLNSIKTYEFKSSLQDLKGQWWATLHHSSLQVSMCFSLYHFSNKWNLKTNNINNLQHCKGHAYTKQSVNQPNNRLRINYPLNISSHCLSAMWRIILQLPKTEHQDCDPLKLKQHIKNGMEIPCFMKERDISHKCLTLPV